MMPFVVFTVFFSAGWALRASDARLCGPILSGKGLEKLLDRARIPGDVCPGRFEKDIEV